MIVVCAFCGEPVDPAAEGTYQRITGWERRPARRASGAKGGSDIVLREHQPEFACFECIRRLREGVATTQITFV